MTLHDTLTTRLAELKAERDFIGNQVAELNRDLVMGETWVKENAERLAEKFSHLFPAAIPEPLVVPALKLPEPSFD